ncbi:MAG: hypothetical protein HY652_03215 [Acidobacteria bacterium]|nr:hypothetical protein [Acidobacteriota bacterium]
MMLLSGWALLDLYGFWSSDVRTFDPRELALLEMGMWRAYYEHEPLRLYWLLVKKLRRQTHFPFLHANVNAYRAAKAATVFQEGSSRADYERVLPYLEAYYRAICRIGRLQSDPVRVARLELEWWIAHRERARLGEAALVQAIAASAAALYEVPAENLRDYARARAAAMLQRDRLAETHGAVTEAEWQEIGSKLLASYQGLAAALKSGTSR